MLKTTKFIALCFLVLIFPTLSTAFTCKINEYVKGAGSEEVIESWIPRNFNITNKEYSEVGYKGHKVSNMYETGNAYIYEITREIKDSAGHLKYVSYRINLQRSDNFVRVEMRVPSYKTLWGNGTCKGKPNSRK